MHQVAKISRRATPVPILAKLGTKRRFRAFLVFVRNLQATFVFSRLRHYIKKVPLSTSFWGKSFFAPSCRMPSILRTIVHCAIVSLREINSFLCSKISHNRDFVRFIFVSPRILPRLLCQGDKAVCGWQAERFQFHAKNLCRKFEQTAKSGTVSMR